MLDTGHLFDVKLFIIDVVFLKIEIYLINNDLLQNLNEVKCARADIRVYSMQRFYRGSIANPAYS